MAAVIGLIILIVLATLIVTGIAALFSAFYTVQQQESAIITRFGKFMRTEEPGLHVKTPFIERVAGRINLRLQQQTVEVETKTNDNVFVRIALAIQYFVPPERVRDAFYRLSSPVKQIEAYVFNDIRANVPSMTLDRVFEDKNEVADKVKSSLEATMTDFGYTVHGVLVTEVIVDPKVQDAMNNVMVATRNFAAAQQNAEANKVIRVKAAEAEMEARILQGQGVAGERMKIMEGLQTAVEAFSGSTGINAHEAMALLLATLHYDTQRDIARASRTNTVFMDSGADGADKTIQRLAGMLRQNNDEAEPDGNASAGGAT